MTYSPPWSSSRRRFFAKLVEGLRDDEAVRALDLALMGRPDQGPLLRGAHGIRKLRWAVPGAGKRGGVRVIYYWYVPGETILFLYLYRKNRQADLTPEQIRALGEVVRKEYR